MPHSLGEVGTRLQYCVLLYSHISSMQACLDGTLHMWQTKSNFVRPSMTVEGAFVKNTEPGSLVFSIDGRTVLTRGGDDTVKREHQPGVVLAFLMRIHAACSLGPSGVQKAAC